MHGNLLWCNAHKKHIVHKFNRVQKKAICCMSKVAYNEHTTPLLKASKILKLTDYNTYPTIKPIYLQCCELQTSRNLLELYMGSLWCSG